MIVWAMAPEETRCLSAHLGAWYLNHMVSPKDVILETDFELPSSSSMQLTGTNIVSSVGLTEVKDDLGCLLHCMTKRARHPSWTQIMNLAHQNRTTAIASDFRVDRAESQEILQKEGVPGSKIAARNRKSLATFHRTLNSQCSTALSRKSLAISGVRDGHRNRKSQKSLRFRCAKIMNHTVGPTRITQLIPREFCGVTKIYLLRQFILWEYFGVISGVLLPKRDNTRWCSFSWELRLLNPQKLFGVTLGYQFPLGEYKILPPWKSWKLPPKLQFGPPRDCP